MKKLGLLAVPVIGIIILAMIVSSDQFRNDLIPPVAEAAITTPSPTPAIKKSYKQVEIGMDHDAFSKLCGKLNLDDNVTTHRTADGVRITYHLKYQDNRKANGCYGMFYFGLETTLKSITR